MSKILGIISTFQKYCWKEDDFKRKLRRSTPNYVIVRHKENGNRDRSVCNDM